MKKITPKVRFIPSAPSIRRHFRGAKFPKDWSTPHLDDLIDEKAPICYGILMPGEHIPNGVPVIKVKDYVKSGLNLKTILRTSPEIDQQYQRSRVKAGDILISIRGGTGDITIVPNGFDGANITQDTARLRCGSGADRLYLAKCLTGTFVQTQIALETVGQAVTGINIGSVRKLIIPVPPISEQRKVAEILAAWDVAIEKSDGIIAAKDRYKKALMQQLLARSAAHLQAGHARHRFGEICERVTRKNNEENDNVLTISAQAGLISQKDYFKRSVAGADLSNYYLLKRGEFAYNRSSAKGYPYGAIKRLEQYDAGVLSTLYLCFRIKPKAEVSPDYLRHYFDSGRLNSGLRAIAKEGARAHGLLNVTSDEFFDLDIFLPSLTEQRQISTILDACNQELTLLRKQRAALDQQKRGLMQRLLTGKLRVKP